MLATRMQPVQIHKHHTHVLATLASLVVELSLIQVELLEIPAVAFRVGSSSLIN